MGILSYLGIGDIKRVEGTLQELGSAEAIDNGAVSRFRYAIVETKSGAVRINDLRTPSDINTDLGRHITLYVRKCLSVSSFGARINYTVAKENEYGFEMSGGLGTFIGAAALALMMTLAFCALTLFLNWLLVLVFFPIYNSSFGPYLAFLTLGVPLLAILRSLLIRCVLMWDVYRIPRPGGSRGGVVLQI